MSIVALVAGCTDKSPLESGRRARPGDTLYTQQAAMSIYGYQPLRALQIIDSAVIVGNLSEEWADLNRARIYSQSQMKELLDSLLGGFQGARLDMARAIGERLLLRDDDHVLRQNVLEMLVYTTRLQLDSVQWLQYSRALVDECRRQGKETKALRTEAEIGASLCFSGQMEEGMAKLDSVIAALQAPLSPPEGGTIVGSDSNTIDAPSGTVRGAFNELDALLIALKRKVSVLASFGREEETLPLAHRMMELLDDYEQHPDQYHDGSYREPQDDGDRADYIRFYRAQAQTFISAAYTALGNKGEDMAEAYELIANTVRDASAREHVARYHALQQQMEAERRLVEVHKAHLLARDIGLICLLALAFAAYALYMSRKTRRKNRVLARGIADALDYKRRYEELEDAMRQRTLNIPPPPASLPDSVEEPAESEPNLEELSEAALFQYLDHAIRHEQMHLSPMFGRQTLADRFHLSDRRLGAAFARGSDHRSLTEYIRALRLEHACRLLKEHPEMTIAEVGTASGFSSVSVFCRSFKERIQMTPSEFQRLNR